MGIEILAFDPGTTTGWARIIDGKPLYFGEWVWPDEFINWLINQKSDYIVVENFRVRPGRNFSWNEMIPIRVIGAIIYHAMLHDIDLYIQEASVLPVAMGMAGFPYDLHDRKKHIPNPISAIAHGVYFYKTLAKKG